MRTFLYYGGMISTAMLLVSGIIPCRVVAQTVEVLTAHPPVSLRGLSAPGQRVVWVSGSSGTVGRSIDEGIHWSWTCVPGYEKRDFRDIEAFNADTALIMGIDTPAVILRTTDGGRHWNEVFRDNTPGMFLDAIAFGSLLKGFVVGDPLDSPATAGSPGRLFLARTQDGGIHWSPFPYSQRPLADSGEGCFASSGTNIIVLPGAMDFAFVTGGPVSRLFKGNAVYPLALAQGSASTGANSIGVDGANWIVVGGDFSHDTVRAGNCLVSHDKGAHWHTPPSPPHGYRSCVIALGNNTWLSCGTSGIDLSYDAGEHWTLITTEGFHAAAYPKSGRMVYLAGSKGRIARLAW